METIRHHKALLGIYLMTMLYALHYGVPMYASSSYLGLSFSPSLVSFIYAVSSMLAFFISLHVAKYLKRFHTYRFTTGVLIVETIVTFALGYTTTPSLLALYFIAHFVLTVLIFIALNTFVECVSPHRETGIIRGMFLTILNLGILISPFIGGAVLSIFGYSGVYDLSAFVLIPFIVILSYYRKYIPEPHFAHVNLLDAIRRAMKDKNLKIALLCMLLLEAFYAVMIIYSPLYITSLGIPLSVYLTAILPIALLPLVLLPYELGILADTRIGEKELMITGLVIMSICSMAVALVNSTNILVWILILTTSRIGASCLETMTYSYYFKKIDDDVGLISLFGNMLPLATIIVPFIGIIIGPLAVTYPSLIFILLSVVLLYGAIKVFPLVDTR